MLAAAIAAVCLFVGGCEQQSTYTLWIKCTNCGGVGFVDVPATTNAADYLRLRADNGGRLHCPYCDCFFKPERQPGGGYR